MSYFEDIFQNKGQLDSQDFYKHIMKERGSRKYGMKAIVGTLASDEVKSFYDLNKHSALGDAETLCRLSNSRSLCDRFKSWVLGFQSMVGPSPLMCENENRRSQSLSRFFPG